MALPVPKVSLRDYLEGEERSELRHEFLDGEVFVMEAATLNHQRVARNLSGSLSAKLAATGCEVLPTPRTATAASGLYTYPDLVIVCGRLETWPTDRNTIANPRVIIEVLSKTTEHYDRGTKYDLYMSLDSFAEYLCVAQDSAWIRHQWRQPDGSWVTRFLTGLDSAIRFVHVPVEIPFSEIYRDVVFDPQPEAGTRPTA